MDKALKQRLVGASVLVALAVVILPMLLGGQPEVPQDARPIEIPPRPQELSSEKRRFPIGETSPEQPSVVPDRDESRASVPDGAGNAGADGTESNPPATLQERLEQVAAAAGSQAPEASPGEAEQGGTASVETPALQTPADNESVAQAPETESGDAVDAGGGMEDATETGADVAQESAPSQAGGRYLVQVASFSSTANADRLAGSLRESGMPVVMDTVDSAAGVLHRVRVGPFEQQAQAQQVVTRLGRQIPDVRPRLVDLRPDEESPVMEPEDPLIRWVVQVGVFSDQANADKLVFELRDAGYSASSQGASSGGNTVYRVRVGPEPRRDEALRLRDRIQAERGIEGIVQSTE